MEFGRGGVHSGDARTALAALSAVGARRRYVSIYVEFVFSSGVEAWGIESESGWLRLPVTVAGV